MNISKEAKIGSLALVSPAVLLAPDANAVAYVEPAQDNLASQGLALELNPAWSWDQLEAEAKACEIKGLLVIGMLVLDNPVIANTVGLAEKDDLVVGTPPDFGEAVVLFNGQEIRRSNLNNRDGYARVNFQGISGEPNAKGRNSLDALRLQVYFDKDKVRTAEGNRVTQNVTIECGKPGWVHAGRYPAENELDEVTTGQFPIRKLGTIIDRAFQQFFPGFTTGMAPQVDNTERNLIDIRNNLPKIKEDLKTTREKEKRQAVTPTPKPAAPPPPPPAAPPEEDKPIDGKGQHIEPDSTEPEDRSALVRLQENFQNTVADVNNAGTGALGASLLIGGGYALWKRSRGT